MTPQPQQFKDSAGRVWTVRLDVDLIDRIAEETGFDLIRVAEGDVGELAKFIGDIRTSVKVLIGLTREDADRRNVSEQDFRKSLDADAMDAGKEAMLEAVASFSRRPKIREILRAAMESAMRMADENADEVIGKLATLKADELPDLTFGEPATSSPASSDATPDRSPTANS